LRDHTPQGLWVLGLVLLIIMIVQMIWPAQHR
jgi:hypothetical protein